MFDIDIPVRSASKHFHNDEYIIFEIFNLRVLIHVEHVLQHEWMDTKLASELLDDVDFVQSVDIHPGDRGSVEVSKGLLDI